MTPCTMCKKPGNITLTYSKLNYCFPCFVIYLQRRMWKDIKQQKALRTGDVLYFTDRSPRAIIGKHLLTYLEDKGISVGKRTGKRVIPMSSESMDVCIEDFLRSWIDGKATKQKKMLAPLRTILDEELNILATYWKHSKTPMNKGMVHEFIEQVRKNHPQTPFSLFKSMEAMR